VPVILKHAGAVLMALVVWWAVTVLCGLGLYAVFPPDLSLPDPVDGQARSFLAGISLGRHWQNIPGNLLGFVSALYAFRILTGPVRRRVAREMSPLTIERQEA
jgi:hypothetical protein